MIMGKRFLLCIFAAAVTLLLVSPHGWTSEEGYKYYPKEKRDPFVPLILSNIRISIGLESIETIDDVKFEGVIFDPYSESLAMLNGEVVKEGYKAYNIEIVKIYNDAITIKIYNKTYTIDLVEEGGE